MPSSALTSRLLIMACLLFATAEIAFSQASPALSINDITVTEGDSGNFGWTFEISLSAATDKTVSVTVSTQDGTATGNADFGAGSTVVNFQPGQPTRQSLTVLIIGDTAVEGTEQFSLNLSDPVNATIADGQGVATIVDDDALILLTQPSSQRAVALDSPLFTQETFPIFNTVNFSSDNRTRIAVFAIGVKFSNGTPPPVTATAEDSQGNVLPQLTVEFVDKLAVGSTPKALSWLTQVVIKMPEPNQIQTLPGDLKIRISSGVQTSNEVLVSVKSQ